MRTFAFSSLRINLILLILLVVLPALGLIVYTHLEQRRTAAAYVNTGIPAEVAYAEADRVLVRNLTWLVFVTLLALAGSYLAARRLIVRPLNGLITAMKRLVSGDLGARAGWPYEKGELGPLARSFDEMAESFERLSAEQKRADELIRLQAYYDGLTGLPNRTLFYDRLQQAIVTAQRESKPVALLLMDLDGFKDINDTLGHQTGDILLKQIGPRLRQALRESDTVARFGGDEFVMLLPGTDVDGAVLAARKMLRSLEEPFAVQTAALNIGASIGIVVFPAHGQDPDTLLRRADVAMYAAKQTGRGCGVYTSEYDQISSHRLALIGELRHAIEQGELVLFYQPKLSFKTNRIVGAEALIRWRHPLRGLIAPSQFIPLVERTPLMKSMTQWVLKEALHQCRLWRQTGLELSIAVNLSSHNMHDPQLPDQVVQMTETWGVPAEWLELEVTESVIMGDPGRAMDILMRLKQMGIRLSIDDFGTGYSSLAYLKRLPVDEIKIDKSFVTHMVLDENDAVIVRSSIDLAHNLGFQVVAEGVENQETRDRLASFGCDAAQGFFWKPPIPAQELTQWAKHVV